MSFLSLTFIKKNKKIKKTSAPTPNLKRLELGRTMLEMLMALLILGMISVGGYAGVRYALGLSQAWRAQSQVNQLAKDVMALYAWQDSYATLSMRGTRGICNAIVSPGNQDCVILSPWNEQVRVEKGNSNGSFKIVMEKTPKSICNHLQDMRFENVYLIQRNCTGGLQEMEFLMDKDDRSCPEGCPVGYDCINGQCRAQDREDACKDVHCVGECLTGTCRGGACIREQDGKPCSIGSCRGGECIEDTMEETTTEEETCPTGEIKVNGTCYSCMQSDPISAGDKADLQGCSNRTISCSTGGTRDCKSFLKACPSGYVGTGSAVCNADEIPINDGSDTWSGSNTGCCSTACPSSKPIRGLDGNCYACNDHSSYIETSLSQCAKCDSTITPREMMGAFCVRKYNCDFGYYQTKGGSCIPCGPGNGGTDSHVAATADQCAACDNTEYPREMVGDNCLAKQTCSQGQFKTEFYPLCANCSDTKAYTTDGVNCATCNKTAYPREFEGKLCVLPLTCPVGQFGTLDRKCYSCGSVTPYLTTSKSCAVCNTTNTPREMMNDYCVLKNCSAGSFKDIGGNCRSCTSSARYEADAASCAVCDNTQYRREMKDGYCVLKTCASGYFKTDTGDCMSCATFASYQTSSAHCAACDGTSYPREIIENYCVLKKTCPEGQFMSNSGNCYSCSLGRAEKSNSQFCAACDGTSYPREMIAGLCVLKKSCSLGQFKAVNFSNSNVNCTSCATVTSYRSDAESCAACNSTPTPRVQLGEYCVPKTCASNAYRSLTGGCYSCWTEVNQESTAQNCAACNQTDYTRELVNGYCSMLCPIGQFHGNDGVCYSCNSLSAPSSTQELCSACERVTVKRKIINGKCTLVES